MLRTIQGTGKTKRLMTFNCNYSDIAQWIEQLEEEQLVTIDYTRDKYGKLVLTKLGRQESGRLSRKLQKKKKK